MIPDGTAVRYVGGITRFHGVEGNIRHRVVRPDEGRDYYVVNLPGAPFGKVHALEHEIFPVTELVGDLERMKGEKARAMGYTSDICSSCQNMTMTRNGANCLKCETCGTTTGCG